MNYIKQLEASLIAKDAALTAAESGINDLRAYLMSEKFHHDTRVQVNDVLLRLNELLHEIQQAAERT